MTDIHDNSLLDEDMDKKRVIERALSCKTKLSKKDFVIATGYSDPDLLLYFDSWHQSLKEKRWHYVDSYLLEQVGYKTGDKIAKEQFKAILTNERNRFKKGRDYVIYDNTTFKDIFDIKKHEINVRNNEILLPVVTGNNLESEDKILNIKNRLKIVVHDIFKWTRGGRAEHIIIQSKCLRILCGLVQTERASRVVRYFVAMEDFIDAYDTYCAMYDSNQLLLESKQAIEEKEAQITELTKDITEAKNKFTLLLSAVKMKEKTGFAYVATCDSNVRLRKFKAGKADNLVNRLSSYNTGRGTNDKYYYLWTSPCY